MAVRRVTKASVSAHARQMEPLRASYRAVGTQIRTALHREDQMAPSASRLHARQLEPNPRLRDRAGVSLQRTPAAPAVALRDILVIAALPSSRRIAGWRTAHFDIAKAAISRQIESDPTARMRPMLQPKADIGPSLDRIPPLVPAIERICTRFKNTGMKSDIRRISEMPKDIQDYVIIGAGMAGVAAGAIFADANHAGAKLKGVVLEAGTAIGGRARDIDVNGHKAGLGPSWLHGMHNMLRRPADLLGLTRVRTYLDREVYIDGRKATKKESDALFKEEDAAEEAMREAVKNGRESQGDAASKFYPKGRFKAVAEAEMGRGDQGANIGQVDAIDGSYFQSDRDDFIKEGMQEFVTRFAKAAELPVAFDARVKSAHRDRSGIWTVTLSDGRVVRSRQVIYTGSTAALTHIAMSPALPTAKLEVVSDALPMGNFTKALFTTEEAFARPGTFQNSWAVNMQSNPRTGKLHESVQFVVKYEGDAHANIMFAAGSVATKLLAMPEAQRKAYVEKEFALVAGHPVTVKTMAITPFAADPLYGGGYSNLEPGMEGAHAVYAAPWLGFNFAGEAAGTAQNNASLLAAFTSGIDSAYDVIAAVRLPK